MDVYACTYVKNEPRIPGDGRHEHNSLYATHQDIDEVKEECEKKISALENDWKFQLNLQFSVFLLLKQLSSTISGVHTLCMCTLHLYTYIHI